MNQTSKSRKNLQYYTDGILRGDRIVLAQAITLIESILPSDEVIASGVMKEIIKKTGNSIRIGITGAPGVGKSTFIERFGKFLTDLGKNVAVLTVDPSSQRTKGSILGDKTRMAELAVNPRAFIRPSSSGSTLGGVTQSTRESLLLCEAAGFDVILVETVGVGQSEVAVKDLTDFFLLLMLPGSGDELQGIKKGIMEMADLVVVTKADGENLKKASQSQADFSHAINTLYSQTTNLIPKVLTASALLNVGIEEIFKAISEVVTERKSNGTFEMTRSQQAVSAMYENFHNLVKHQAEKSPTLAKHFYELEAEVKTSRISPGQAAKKMLIAFNDQLQGNMS